MGHREALMLAERSSLPGWTAMTGYLSPAPACAGEAVCTLGVPAGQPTLSAFPSYCQHNCVEHKSGCNKRQYHGMGPQGAAGVSRPVLTASSGGPFR